MSDSFDEKLFSNRIVVIDEEVGAGTASNVISRLLLLSDQNSSAPIRIYMATSCRLYTDAMAIYDVMMSLPNPLEGYVIGCVGGYALPLIAGCTKGKRYMLKNSQLNFMEPMVFLKPGVQQTETLIEVEEAKEEREALEKVLSFHTGRSLEEIQKAIDDNEIFTAEEAVKFGLVDKVI
ncbi:MAG: ATP-dependent Clp protease proteolytic subunit [Bacilli bacterium]|nr:ATP-dependent Clp protease proteolytic subunit [Bacilli bacterium]